jgi:hypothetical protein
LAPALNPPKMPSSLASRLAIAMASASVTCKYLSSQVKYAGGTIIRSILVRRTCLCH